MGPPAEPSVDVELFQPGGEAADFFGLPSASPFVTKLHLFLRAADIPYVVRSFHPRQAPRGKMPYVRYRGELLSDSQLIMGRLVADYGIAWDARLRPEERHLAHLVRRTLEEASYFVVLWSRWCVEDNWRVIKKAYFGDMPPVVRSVLPDLLRRSVRRTTWGQGVARYAPEELDAMLTRDLEAVRAHMAPEGYFFGERFSSLDCTVFPFLAAVFLGDFPKPIASSMKMDRRLTTYVEHVRRGHFVVPGPPY